ncbi:MAG TPA: AEC family transporter, partial [Anaerolineae bacterium]|nr:AEC family transporter [Anaerolineae bacterium]
MFWQLSTIFFNVIVPVFAVVTIGWLAGPRLGLEARTLARLAYYILIPAFVFDVMSTAVIQSGLAVQMIGYILVVHLAVALLAFFLARGLGRPSPVVGAYVVIAVFGNVGNFGLPLIEFRLGEAALPYATIYFLAIVVIAFVISVAAANWVRGGSVAAVTAVFKTPALLALLPALLVNSWDITPPLLVSRIVGLLAAAMVPVMLLALGVQLAAAHRLHLNRDVIAASSIRLLAAPLLAFALAIPFGL